jgi:dihydropyrimidinase
MPRARVDVVVHGGLVVTPSSVTPAAIAIEDGRIVAVGNESMMPDAERAIDVKGRYVFPGLIDAHTHIWSEGFGVTTQAAAYGGVTTTLIFLRGDANDNIFEVATESKRLAAEQAHCDYGFHVYLFDRPSIIEEIEGTMGLGIPTFKMFMAYKKRQMKVSNEFMLKAMQTMKRLGATAMVHAENGEMIDVLEDQMIAAGCCGPEHFYPTRPNVAEAEAVYRAIEIASYVQCPLYIVHLSSAEGLVHIKRARDAGLPVATETCPQYLLLTDDDTRKFGALAKIAPPLRTRADNDALWRGLERGWIPVLATDHASYPLQAKEIGKRDIFQAPFGAPGVETLVSLAFSEGVIKRGLSPTWLAQVLSENPAKIFQIFPKKGAIQPGSDADLVVIDPDRRVILEGKNLHQAAGYTLFEGHEVRGWPVLTMVRGQVLLENGEVKQGPGFGQFIHRPIGANGARP